MNDVLAVSWTVWMRRSTELLTQQMCLSNITIDLKINISDFTLRTKE